MKYSSSIYAKAFLGATEEKEVLSKIIRNFLKILKKNNDLAKLSEILRLLEPLIYKKSGVAKFEVVMAKNIEREVGSKIHERFGKNADINFIVSPEIIGGVIIKINEEIVIDASVRRRLEKLFVKN